MQHYTINVETTGRAPFSPDEIDAAMDALALYAPSLSMSPYGHRQARVTVPGDTLAQAVNTACAVVSAAVAGEPIGVTALREAEADLREGAAAVPDLIGVTDAAEVLGVSGTRVRQMIDEGKLAAYRVGDRAWALVRSEVAARAADAVKPAHGDAVVAIGRHHGQSR